MISTLYETIHDHKLDTKLKTVIAFILNRNKASGTSTPGSREPRVFLQLTFNRPLNMTTLSNLFGKLFYFVDEYKFEDVKWRGLRQLRR